MKIQTPPILTPESLKGEAGEKLFKELQKARITDEKGRYFHWNDIYYKRSQYADPTRYWLATKLTRKQNSKTVALANTSTTQFSLCNPDIIQSNTHEIDKLAAGNIDANNEDLLSNAQQNRYLISSLIQEEIITSAQLEGATTTYTKAKAMLNSGATPETESEIMILNNYKLLKAAKEYKDLPLSKELILEWHLLATEGAIGNHAEPGAFRTDDSIAVKDKQSQELIHQPPSASEIDERMNELCDFANQAHTGADGTFIHPVTKAIILHFMVGFIHPFGDGNGRVARALFYWYMLKSGYWLFEYISISKLLKEAPIKYQKAYLYSESDQGDLTYFIDYQLKVCRQAIDNLLAYLKRKQEEYTSVLLALREGPLEGVLKKVELNLLKDALKNPGLVLTAKTVSNKYDVAPNSARTHLRALAEAGLLFQTKNGREDAFISPADLTDRLKRLKRRTP